MRRSVSLVLGLVAGAALFSACRDAGVAPAERGAPVALPVPPVDLNELSASPAGITFSVTIDPRRDNIYSDGINAVRIPAGTICDPASSSYGPAYWDAPCTPASATFKLPVRVSRLNRGIVLHFGTDLRFVPTADPAKQVQLVVNASRLSGSAAALRAARILWVPGDGDTFVDEGAADPALATIVREKDGQLVRRLKHFSGYYVHLGAGSECEPGVDMGCMPR